MGLNLGGVIPPLATPFKESEIDLAAFKSNLERYNKTELSGYLVMGSNGEAAYLEPSESERLLAEARTHTPPDKLLLAGTGRESTPATIAFTRRAAELGADAALVLPPHYYKAQMTPARLKRHYWDLAEASPIPVLYYNVPFATGHNVPVDLVVELAEHPNLVGIKDSSGNMLQLSEIVRRTPDDFAVFCGASAMLYPSLCLGAQGGILAVANVVPEVCTAIAAAFAAGDMARALGLHRRLTTLASLVTSGWGVPGLKAAMNLAGLSGGQVRPPLSDLQDPGQLETLRREIAQLQSNERLGAA